VIEREVFKAPSAAVTMAMFNLDESIMGFCARLLQLRLAA